MELPKIWRHASGQARVRLNGHDVLLGPWGSEEARFAYDRAIAEWQNAGQVWPPPSAHAELRLDVLSELYLQECAKIYRKGDRLLASYGLAAAALKLLYRRFGRNRLIEEFRPTNIKEFQGYLASTTALCRNTINKYVREVIAMFKWAAVEELVSPEHYAALRLVPRLARGRPAPGTTVVPPETAKVAPPDPAAILAAKKHLPPMLCAMIELQQATGMRPQELCAMRSCDIKPTEIPGTFVYLVHDHWNKTAHEEIEREVYLGPKAMEIVRPWLSGPPGTYMWSPRKAERSRQRTRRKQRKHKLWPSHAAKLKSVAGGSCIHLGQHYTTESYRRAISRACIRAKLEPEMRWSPNQLRHAAATHIANTNAIEVAQLLLGHRSIQTTMIYVKVRSKRAAEAASRM